VILPIFHENERIHAKIVKKSVKKYSQTFHGILSHSAKNGILFRQNKQMSGL